MAFTPNVVDGNIILAAWGNEIRDRTCQVFATAAERDSQWSAPPNGAICVTLDTNTMWRRMAGAWANRQPFIQSAAATATTDGFGNTNIALPSGAKWIGVAANGAQTSFPKLIICNATDGPPNSTLCFLNIRNPDGTPVGSSTISYVYVLTYTF